MDLLRRRGKPAQIFSISSAVLLLLNLKRNEVWFGTGSLKPVLHFLSLEQALFLKGQIIYLDLILPPVPRRPNSTGSSRGSSSSRDETLIKPWDALILVPLTSPDRLEARFWLKHRALYSEAKDSGYHSPFLAWIRVYSRWALVLCSALFE